MKTGIGPLDKLLGDAVPPENEQLPDQISPNGERSGDRDSPVGEYGKYQTMLIRGAPGSGKTSLALQIMANHIAQDREVQASFMSLEVEPDRAWLQVSQLFNPVLQEKIKDKNRRFNMMSRGDIEAAIPYADWHAVEMSLRNKLKDVRGLLVVDSINLLADIIKHRISSPAQPADLRAIMHGIWTLLEAINQNPDSTTEGCNIILVGEHHPGVPYDVSLLSESFACDIELLLAPEPIAGMPDIPANFLGPLGYAFERKLQKTPLSDEPQSVEIRSFCRILKSRFSANQSRRCAYDVVNGEGVKFTETYPGDGQVLLFHENSRQKEMWENFLKQDVPHQFPALRYRLFDPKNVQRTFATQRQFSRLHQKTDMYLACFDTYWINWYWQLGRRTRLRELLLQLAPGLNNELDKLSPDDELKRSWCRFLCSIDKCVRDQMDDGHETAMVDDNLLTTIAPSLLANANITTGDSNAITNPARIREVIVKAIREMRREKFGIFHFIPRNKLRLFGERRSPIIEELEDKNRQNNSKPIDRNKRLENGVHWLRFSGDNHSYISIPYNANVSFLVYQSGTLNQRLQEARQSGYYSKALKSMTDLHQKELFRFQALQEERMLKRKPPLEVPVPEKSPSSVSVTDINVNSTGLPASSWDPFDATNHDGISWEQIFLLCTNGFIETDLSKRPHDVDGLKHVVFETQSYDTLLCTVLEVFWGVGGELNITPEYEVEQLKQNEQKLFHAFFLLKEMFRHNVIERFSTVNPKEFAKRYQEPNDNQWLVARHWYSTYIELLTAKQAPPKFASEDHSKWVWTPPKKSTMEIRPLPHSLFSRDKKAVSCWGEWHIAVVAGTENEELAVELINHFMSSAAICERANRCAALPTDEEFYKRYGDVPCVRIPERGDISMPMLSFSELREKVFRIARSRRTIFDYRHCMRELHSVLAHIHHDPIIDTDKLSLIIMDAVDRIRELKYQEVMSH